MDGRLLIVVILCGVLLTACKSAPPPSLAPEDLIVYFGSRSADLVSSEREKIDRLAVVLGHSEDVTVTVAGFAGAPGDPVVQMSRLALARTLVVRDVLVTDLRKTNARQIRLAYRTCGIAVSDKPSHRVDIFVTGSNTEVPDPCRADAGRRPDADRT